MEIIEIDRPEWNRALPNTGFEVFHAPTALSVIDRHAPGELRLFAGYKGEQPVGLMPVVETRRGIGRAVLSPPPAMGIPRLGPILMPTSPKRRSQEKLNRRFVRGVLDRVGAEQSRSLLKLICPPSYPDPRAFHWEGLDVETTFTYLLETEGKTPEDIQAAFSKSLRRDIRDGRKTDIDVSVESPKSAELVHDTTAARYEEQGRSYPLDREYVTDLVTSLSEVDRARVYVARERDGTFVSGITVLYSNDAAYFWQGGTRTEHDGVSVNSLIHWRIIEDVIDDPPRESVTGYDLMGANTERLCKYKSKFGADLVPYYSVESSGPLMALAKTAYRAMEVVK